MQTFTYMWEDTYMPERRSKSRIPLRVTGKINMGDRSVPCLLLDLSEHGLAVLTSSAERPKGPVQVRFRLGGVDAARAEIDAELVLRRDSEAGMNSMWGLRSIGLDLGTRTRVRDFIRTHSLSH